MKCRYVLPTTLALVLVAGCQSNMNKEDWGKTIGTVGGAVLGAAVAGGDNKWLGAAIGAAAGYFAGSMIGRHLNEQDQKALAEETVAALDDQSAGKRSWKSEDSGASANIKTGEIAYQSKQTEVRRLSEVEAVPNIKLENREYQTTSALRVRQGPSTRYSTVTTLKPGDVVTSTGRTDNGWLMLAKQGVTVGYVHGNYVKPLQPVSYAKSQGIDLDSVDAADIPKQEGFAGIDLDAVETETTLVTAQVGCRDVQISVKTEKGTETETTQACQQDDGVWELG